MLIDAAGIAALIPHGARMCLLEGVQRWDATSIACVSGTHRDPANPLRRDGQLAAICGVEYAAQAMALHAALTSPPDGRARAGYLASLRQVHCHATWLDEQSDELLIEVNRVFGESSHAVYEFRVSTCGRALLTGRAAVVLSVA